MNGFEITFSYVYPKKDLSNIFFIQMWYFSIFGLDIKCAIISNVNYIPATEAGGFGGTSNRSPKGFPSLDSTSIFLY